MSAGATSSPRTSRLLSERAPHPRCRASVIVPARNEEKSLRGTLTALANQKCLNGRRLDPDLYEILLLLNNCTDRSKEVAQAFQREYPEVHLHIYTRRLRKADAHVGTARRMLMDTACARLERNIARQETLNDAQSFVLLSTDADTVVSPNWIAGNLKQIAAGADCVGGMIHLRPGELRTLARGIRRAYNRDRRYQRLVAELESMLDPDPADPWPRHLQHFGASLACTCAIYRRCGGMPAVKPLEDVAFVNALRRVGARIRHAQRVFIHTSARLDGRAEVGLSGQLKHWLRDAKEGRPHLVDSAEWIQHRFRTLRLLRRFSRAAAPSVLAKLPAHWHRRLLRLQEKRLSTARFLELLDYEALIQESFHGALRHDDIKHTMQRLRQTISLLRRKRKARARAN